MSWGGRVILLGLQVEVIERESELVYGTRRFYSTVLISITFICPSIFSYKPPGNPTQI